MESFVLFAAAPMIPRTHFLGISARGLRLVPLGQQQQRVASGPRVPVTALTPRTPDPEKAKKKGRKKELEQWQKMIDRDLNGDKRGIGFWPVGSSVRTAQENRERVKRTRRRNEKLMKRVSKAVVDTVLDGGPLDFLLYTLRARYLERMHAEEVEGKDVPLTEDVEALYELAIKEIRKCDALYYADDPVPHVADREYDELVMHLLDLERAYPTLVRPDSPSQTVGHSAAGGAAALHDAEEADGERVRAAEMLWRPKARTFAQAQHPVRMLSLANAYSRADLASFAKKVEHSGSRVSVEMKIDGIALSLHYERRALVLAATRGNGRVGDDVTDNIRAGLVGRGVLAALPPDAPDGLVIVRGEVFISPDDFRAVQHTSESKLSNARNAAAGAVKQKNPAEVALRRPQFVAYECLLRSTPSAATTADDDDAFTSAWPTQGATLEGLAQWGFGAMPKFAAFDTIEEVEAFAAEMETARAELPFEADGVVLKISDSAKRIALGHTAKAPRGAIALKFTARSVHTVVNAVRMQVSRTGAITPVAELAPVVLGGATIARATLHNFDEVSRLAIAVGDTVLLERGGDVIPKIVAVSARAKRRVPIAAPSECPCCGAPVRVEKADGGATTVACTDAVACAGQNLGRLLHFVGRDAMDIAGVGTKTASKLLDAGLVVRLADIFKLSVEDIMGLDGFQEKSSRALHAAIESAAAERTLERLIIALGVPGIGRSSARALALSAVTIDGLRKLTRGGDATLLNMPNVAEKSATRIAEYLGSVRLQGELAELGKTVELKGVVDEPGAADADDPGRGKTVVDGIEISGKVFAVTGTLNSMPRAEAVKRIKAAGGKISSTVTRKTDYLISGVDPGFKYHKAQRLGVPILFEEDLEGLFRKADCTGTADREEGASAAELLAATPKLLLTEEVQKILNASDEAESDNTLIDAIDGVQSRSSASKRPPPGTGAEIETMSFAEAVEKDLDALGIDTDDDDEDDYDSASSTNGAKKRESQARFPSQLRRDKKGFRTRKQLKEFEAELRKYDDQFSGAPDFPTEEELDRELAIMFKDPEVLAHLAALEKKFPVD